MAAKPDDETIDYTAIFNDALEMPFRELEKHCAKSAAMAGKFLASARAILEADLPYFLELRQRLNAQGQRGSVEGDPCGTTKGSLVRSHDPAPICKTDTP
jgi:hypothetical protein